MNKFWIMFAHAFLSKLKTKSFIITTLLVSVGIFVIANIGQVIEVFKGETSIQQVAVLDQTGFLFSELDHQVRNMREDIELIAAKQSIESLESKIEEGSYAGVLILTSDSNGLPEAVYKSNSLSENTVASVLQVALQDIKSSIVTAQLQLSEHQVNALNAPVDFKRKAIVEGAKSEEELDQARGIIYVILFFIYFSVIMYANMIAMEVATEKSSRVMEILISSVSPVKQMFAKILGIGLVGLTQQVIFLMVGYGSIVYNKHEQVGQFFEVFGFSELSMPIIVYAIVFFLLGYFLYATLAALLGSLVSRIEDVQQNILPMTFLVMIGFFIAMFGLGNPESTFITITSYLPFFTPMVMFLRVGMLNISILEPLIGISILVLSIIILGVFGARVYRGGVLLYGKSNSYKDIKKAIEITKN